MPARLALWIIGFALLCAAVYAEVPSDAAIRALLAKRAGENTGIGIVVGVVDANGRRIVSSGRLAKDDPRHLDGDTVFEIGSMTKVFTSLLLMDMVRRGDVSVDDPVSKYLPAGVRMPERNGRKITLADLATQSSGLPRMPSNFHPKDDANPYADYSIQQMYEFLSGYQLTRDIGSQYEYSNLGVGLLGHVLTLRAGMSYEELVRTRICGPLGMKDTRITLTPDMRARLAVGHNATLAPVANWDIPTLAGAGALRSTANDMLKFLGANLGYEKSPLAQAMADEVSIRRPAGSPNMQIAYGWHIQTKEGKSIIWHNGGTGGYRTYMGYDPKTRVGVVVLSNFANAAGPDDIGRHLLDASYELQQTAPPQQRQEITLDPKVFDRYVATYRLAPRALMTISRSGDHFYGQLTGQPKIEIFPESDRKFFLKVVDAQLTFDVNGQGEATQVTLHQNGRDMVAKRLSDAEVVSAAATRAAPGTEAALRAAIQGLQNGKPNYEQMSAELADVTRQQLTQLKATLEALGALQSVTFQSVGPGGGDVYEVKFEHGATVWTIVLGPDGKIAGLLFRPV